MSADLVQGGMFTVMVVRVDDPNDPGFESQLAEQVARSPAFFANAPVVLDLKNATGCATADAFQVLRKLLKRQHLIVVGIQNGNATQIRAAMNADLAAFPATAVRRAEPSAARVSANVAANAPATAKAPPPVAPPNSAAAGSRTKIVTQPVRSGTQIYARGGDLIVLNAVSPGAEVIADGHVHIYGPLRGRAIAGAAGDPDARIFVEKLEAELVCVAGNYLVNEAIAKEHLGKSVQVTLENGELVITAR